MRRPYTVLVAIISLILGAWLAWERMPRDIFPNLGIPTIYVAQPYGGMDPAQMEGNLTYYYEYHFLYITGIEHVESKSIQGASIIKLQFHPGTDMSQAMSETVAQVNRARAFMPPGTVPPFVMRFDAGSVPVGNLVFASETRSVGQLQDAALNLVRPLFATLPGVSAPPPFGGSARAIVVNLRPNRLRALQVTPDDVAAAVASANVITPSGNILLGDKYPMTPLNSVVKNIKDLEATPIRTGVYPTVFLRDIADVRDASDIVTCYALVNGRRTVYIPVTKRADASTLAVVSLVKANLPRFQSVLPDDVKVSYEFDQSPFVTRAIADLTREGWLGAVLTGLMVLIFLRDWRSALIVVLNIPIALMAALLALWAAKQTINLMTLSGLALAVGILVDEATVAVENIHTHLAKGDSPSRATLNAINETALPRLLAMLCLIAVFVPAFFMQGAAKALFAPLALAVGFAMFFSFILSSTLAPVLSAWFLRGHAEVRENSFILRLANAQRSFTSALMPARWGLVPICIAVFLAGAWLLSERLGREIFPRVDAGQLLLRVRAPAGTRLDRTENLATNILQIIQREAGAGNVKLTLGFVGAHAPSYPINLVYQWNSGPEEAVLQVQLKEGVRAEPLKEKLRERFRSELPGDIEISFEPADIISRVMSYGAATPVEVAVSGPNLASNRQHAQKLKDRLSQVKIFRDVQFGQTLDYPTVDIALDRERAGLLGVKTSDAARSLVAATSSSRFTSPVYWADPNSGVAYQVQVQAPQGQIGSLEEVRNIPVSQRDGQQVLLRNVAHVANGSTVGEYDRYNMQRMITVKANLEGAELGQARTEVEAALRDVGAPPPRVNVAVRGQIEPFQQMIEGLQGGLWMAIIVIFLMLLANFQSVGLALAVLSAVPAVLFGAVGALWLTGVTLNIQSFIGTIMAVGVAMANAILLVSHAREARLAGAPPTEAALKALAGRFRPIVMTALAMIAGMLPMALGLGQAGQQTAPLGRAVIGGLVLGAAATLTLVPMACALARGSKRIRNPSLHPDDLQPIAAEH